MRWDEHTGRMRAEKRVQILVSKSQRKSSFNWENSIKIHLTEPGYWSANLDPFGLG
jgi:hypothetical protein